MDDFVRLGNETPMLADFRPSGKYVMEDLHKIGGVPASDEIFIERRYVARRLHNSNWKNISRKFGRFPDLTEGQDLLHTIDNPIKKTSHIRILYGNLAREGAVAKITGKEGERFEGTAKCYDTEQDAIDAMKDKKS
jgi:dihydroxy-acid dehydratase